MKHLLAIVMLLLLPISASAGVKFEKYNAAIGWDIDTTWVDSVCISATGLGYIQAGDFTLDITTPRKIKHDTLQEYIVGLDTVIILHRVECDTNFTKFFVENDSTFVQIEGITCDTIFRVDFRDVWAPRVRVYLDSLQWRKLLEILSGR